MAEPATDPGALAALGALARQALAILVPVGLGAAWFGYAERKLLAAIQLRHGPSRVGPLGLLQPLADGLKLVAKETVFPVGSNRIVFLLAPIVTVALALVGWAVIPLGPGRALADLDVGALFLAATSSLAVFGVILAGWAANARTAFRAALRAAARMLSFEVAIGLVLVSVVLPVGSLNLTAIVDAQQRLWFVVPHLPMFVLFFVATLAVTDRPPFDAADGATTGVLVEYSGVGYGLFRLGRSAALITMCALASVLFLGGYLPPVALGPVTWASGPAWLGLKVSGLMALAVWVRAAVPRYRFDQAMRIAWKLAVPAALAWVVVTAAVLVALGRVPGAVPAG